MNKFQLIEIQENAYLAGVHAERKRITDLMQNQVEILKDEINETKSELMRQGWAIAGIEITDLITLINNPIKEYIDAKARKTNA